MTIGDLPPLSDDAIAVADALRRGLDRALGDAFASLFLYGAAAFARPPGWRIDFDFHALVHRPLAGAEREAISALHGELAALSPLGADLDGYYVLLADAGGSEPPRHQLDLRARDNAWALHRAHVLAGRYFLISGLDPLDIVVEPTWAELETGLRSELTFVETHPSARAFGILNCARILYSFETHDVVHSKYEAGLWAVDSLAAEWQPAIRAALRFYEKNAAGGDEQTIEAGWEPFAAYARGALPVT